MPKSTRKDSTKVKGGEEYRILALDRKRDVYRFIPMTKRDDIFSSCLRGESLVLPRYACYKAFVFPVATDYPTFIIDDGADAFQWAEKNCIEERNVPKWWTPEFADRIVHGGYSHDGRRYENAHDCGAYHDPDYYMYMTKEALRRMREEDQELEYYI
jgi:hypothetical protein